MKKKVLYFEGAGMPGSSSTDVGNCRIRTAFSLDDGTRVFLGLSEWAKPSKSLKDARRYSGWNAPQQVATADLYNIKSDKRIQTSSEVTSWSLAGICEYVNSLGASFDAVVVLQNMAGYRVFKESSSAMRKTNIRRYNYGDKFRYKPRLTAKRQEIFEKIYELEKEELEQDYKIRAGKFVHSPTGCCYPNFSLWCDENDIHTLHLLRHFNGFNKHWEIDIRRADPVGEMKETTLGRYGC